MNPVHILTFYIFQIPFNIMTQSVPWFYARYHPIRYVSKFQFSLLSYSVFDKYIERGVDFHKTRDEYQSESLRVPK